MKAQPPREASGMLRFSPPFARKRESVACRSRNNSVDAVPCRSENNCTYNETSEGRRLKGSVRRKYSSAHKLLVHRRIPSLRFLLPASPCSFLSHSVFRFRLNCSVYFILFQALPAPTYSCVHSGNPREILVSGAVGLIGNGDHAREGVRSRTKSRLPRSLSG